MPEWKRLAVYVIPRPGAFAACAAEWLGWDPVEGRSLPHPDLPGLPGPPADLTAEPRRYGFHGTLRAPFRPAGGVTIERVSREVGDLAQRLAPAACDGLGLESIDGFLAFTPTGPDAALRRLAAAVVEGTDALRAPLSEAEMARRGPERLSPRQRSFLLRWGYPFVMEDFRFHMTLSCRLARDEAAMMAPVLAAHFAPVLPRPFVVEDLCLCGEDGRGRFHLLDRYALSG